MGMEIDIVENGKKAIKKELTSLPQNIQNLNVSPTLDEKIKSSATEFIQNTNLNLYPQNLIDLPETNPTTITINNIEDNQNIFPQENAIDAQAFPVSNIQPEIDIGDNYPVESIETNQETYLQNNYINHYIEEPAPIQTPIDELNQIFSQTKNKIENIKDTAKNKIEGIKNSTQTLIGNPIAQHIVKNKIENIKDTAKNKIVNIKDTAQTLISNPIAYHIAKNQVQNQVQNLYQSATNQIGAFDITNPIKNSLATQPITSYVGQINDNVINTIQNEYNNLDIASTKYLSAEEVSKALSTNITTNVDNKINDVKDNIKQKSNYLPTPLEHLENVIHTKYVNKFNLQGTNNAKTEDNNAFNTPNYDTPYGNETILNGRPVKIIKIEDEENIQICPDSLSSFFKILFA